MSPQTDANRALTIMSRSGTSRLLVVQRGELLGVVTLKDLLEYLSTRLELEREIKDAA